MTRRALNGTSWIWIIGLSVIAMSAASGVQEAHPYKFPTLPYFPPLPVSADNPVTVEGAELGRMLFYDPVLSKDSSLSCSSCHQQRYAFSDGPQTFSTGLAGQTMVRNTPALFNLAWYPAFFWDGRAASLEEQVSHPVRVAGELGAGWDVVVDRLERGVRYPEKFYRAFGTDAVDSVLAAKAIAQYLRTLISANSLYDRALRREYFFTEDERAGFVLANEQNKGDCLQCHTTDSDALGTARGFSNNGLELSAGPETYLDVGRGAVTGRRSDLGQFKVPSLRNVAVTAPYMHDGRFSTLEEVIDHYSDAVHGGPYVDPRMGSASRGGANLSALEKRQLLQFLHTLTDTTFLSDNRFGDPFQE